MNWPITEDCNQIASAKLIAAIEAVPESVVVTKVWFAPAGTEYLFDDKIWLMAEDDLSILELIPNRCS